MKYLHLFAKGTIAPLFVMMVLPLLGRSYYDNYSAIIFAIVWGAIVVAVYESEYKRMVKTRNQEFQMLNKTITESAEANTESAKANNNVIQEIINNMNHGFGINSKHMTKLIDHTENANRMRREYLEKVIIRIDAVVDAEQFVEKCDEKLERINFALGQIDEKLKRGDEVETIISALQSILEPIKENMNSEIKKYKKLVETTRNNLDKENEELNALWSKLIDRIGNK